MKQQDDILQVNPGKIFGEDDLFISEGPGSARDSCHFGNEEVEGVHPLSMILCGPEYLWQ